MWEDTLLQIARTIVGRPSKGVRAALVQAAYHLVPEPVHTLPPTLPHVLELIHAGSLLVDDVADGATERRGAAALHHLYPEPLTVNAGGWLYFLPLTIIDALEIPDLLRLRLFSAATRAMRRAHEGQALDLGARLTQLSCDDRLTGEIRAVVQATSALKTGALLGFAAEAGVIAAGGDASLIATAQRFGEMMGVGLQMYDDLSALIRPDRAHKADEDLTHLAPTWGWVWHAEHLGADATRVLLGFASGARGSAEGRRAVHEQLAVAARARGREAARKTLDAACAHLSSSDHVHAPGAQALIRAARSLESRYV